MEQPELELFHGRHRGRGIDVRRVCLAVLICAVCIPLYYLNANMGSFRLPWQILFWVVVIAGPLWLLVTIVDLARPGPRKVVYGVSDETVATKIVRGAGDPLWSAARAPASVASGFLGEHAWPRKGMTVDVHPDVITLGVDQERTFAFGKKRTTVRIWRADLADLETFDRLQGRLR